MIKLETWEDVVAKLEEMCPEPNDRDAVMEAIQTVDQWMIDFLDGVSIEAPVNDYVRCMKEYFDADVDVRPKWKQKQDVVEEEEDDEDALL